VAVRSLFSAVNAGIISASCVAWTITPIFVRR
jgi:hypothetical protein